MDSFYQLCHCTMGQNIPPAPGRVEVALLFKQQKKINRKNVLSNCMDYPQLCCLPGLECIHVRTEWCLATGPLVHPPEMMLPCKNNCHIFKERHRKYFLSIVHTEAYLSLKSKTFVDSMSVTLAVDALNILINLLANSKYWLFCVCWEEHHTSLHLRCVFPSTAQLWHTSNWLRQWEVVIGLA